MARVLTFVERHVDASTRAGYLASVDARRRTAATLGANFWVFEHVGEAGRFVEFTEGDGEAAVRAVQGRPDHESASLALWREVRGE